MAERQTDRQTDGEAAYIFDLLLGYDHLIRFRHLTEKFDAVRLLHVLFQQVVCVESAVTHGAVESRHP